MLQFKVRDNEPAKPVVEWWLEEINGAIVLYCRTTTLDKLPVLTITQDGLLQRHAVPAASAFLKMNPDRTLMTYFESARIQP